MVQRGGGAKIGPGWFVAAGLAVLGLVAVGVPLVSLLYVGILLLCPLMMAGMHRGHGPEHTHGRGEPPQQAGPPMEGGRR